MKTISMKLKFFIIFVVLAIATILLINKYYQSMQEERLQQATKVYTRAYDTAYKEKQKLSKAISSGLIWMEKLPQRLARLQTVTQEQKDKIRENIYQDLLFRFEKLKTVGISYLQIHLPNNESFLRMNNPSKYGDNLVTIRPSVVFVSQNHKAYAGMEIGRLVTALRFVYPIFYKHIYVGSIEVSYQISAITSSIMRQYYVLSNFFVKKDIVDKKQFKGTLNNYYSPSHHKGYYYDKMVLKELKKVSRKDMKELKPAKQITDQIRKMGQKDIPSSLYDKSIDSIITIIPIVNKLIKENIGFLTVRSKANSSINYIYFIYILSVGFLALAVYLLYVLVHKKDELAQIVQGKTEELNEINKNLEQKVQEKTKELQKLNTELEAKIAKALSENTKQLETLQQQSKLASMGEMIGAIAHQWRQPLNELGLSIQNLKYDFQDGLINEEFIKEFIDYNKKTIMFMSKTIDDFRNFFRVDKEKKEFNVKETTQSVLAMLSAQLKNHNIEVETNGKEFAYKGLQSEYKQVILNIINNAKDALIENKTKNPKIEINIKDKKVTIKDNGGGIPKDIIERVFEPYFTTKDQGKGTGMGLYMSKMIIEENMGGKLSIKNEGDGACFTIDLNEQPLVTTRIAYDE